MPFQGSAVFPPPRDHPLGPYPVVEPDDGACVMLVSFMELLFVKPGFVDLRPGGAKPVPPPPVLPAASAEAPIVSNNPAAATNAT